jgi:hypothetical protein
VLPRASVRPAGRRRSRPSAPTAGRGRGRLKPEARVGNRRSPRCRASPRHESRGVHGQGAGGPAQPPAIPPRPPRCTSNRFSSRCRDSAPRQPRSCVNEWAGRRAGRRWCAKAPVGHGQEAGAGAARLGARPKVPVVRGQGGWPAELTAGQTGKPRPCTGKGAGTPGPPKADAKAPPAWGQEKVGASCWARFGKAP